MLLVMLLLSASCNAASPRNSTSTAPIRPDTPDSHTLQKPQSSLCSTVQWSAYSSSKYHYEFQYPASWSLLRGDVDGADLHLSNQSSVPEVGLRSGQVVIEIQGPHTKDPALDLFTYVKENTHSAAIVNICGINVVESSDAEGGDQTGTIGYYVSIDESHYLLVLMYAYPGASLATAETIVSTLRPFE